MPRFVRTSRKLYLRIPGGEIQWGRISKRLTVWFRGRRRTIARPQKDRKSLLIGPLRASSRPLGYSPVGPVRSGTGETSTCPGHHHHISPLVYGEVRLPGRNVQSPSRSAKQGEASRSGRRTSAVPARRAASGPKAATPAQNPAGLPLLRNSERSTVKRCEWAWWVTYNLLRKPLSEMPALRFGSLVHGALAQWYIPGVKRGLHPATAFEQLYEADLKVNRELFGMRTDDDDAWHNAAELGVAMLNNYTDEYGNDEQWEVLVTEWPWQQIVYKLDGTPWFNAVGIVDGVWRNRKTREIWIPEHKTARGLGDNKYRYLQLDDQAGMYWSFGVQALVAAGMLKKGQQLHGILYNFLRKAMPDERASKIVKKQRLYLNLDGSISKKQPQPYFKRLPVFRDQPDRSEAIRRARVDYRRLEMLRSGELELSKTPGQFTCPMCAVRDACELHEVGQDWEGFMASTMQAWDPYAEHEIYAGR